VFGYHLYSFWTLDQPTEGIVGGTFYQLHYNAPGITANYQNQINSANLLHVDADYTKDLTLRYNYGNYFTQQRTAGEPGGAVVCGNPGDPFGLIDPAEAWSAGNCANNLPVQQIKGPYAYWSSTTPITSDFVVSDSYKPSDKMQFDVGVRFDMFKFGLMPLQITGANGLAEQAQNQFGICLHGYRFAPGEKCNNYDSQYSSGGGGGPQDAPGAANWQDVSGDLTFNEFSPRFGMTYTVSNQDVVRFSVDSYVQPPDEEFEE
jgi:hypothetical protein